MSDDHSGRVRIGYTIIWIVLGAAAGALLAWAMHTAYVDFVDRLADHLGYPAVTSLKPLGVAADLERLLWDIEHYPNGTSLDPGETQPFDSLLDRILASKTMGSANPNIRLLKYPVFNIPEVAEDPSRYVLLAALVGGVAVAVLVRGIHFIQQRDGSYWMAVWSILWIIAIWRVAEPWWRYHKMEKTMQWTGGGLGGAAIGMLFLIILLYQYWEEYHPTSS